MICILFYDFEVFKYDWLVVIMDMDAKKEYVVVNDSDKLQTIYEAHVNDIWTGFNNIHYDQYIFKGILLGLDPKKINDFIILGGQDGWKYSSAFRTIPMINYDVMLATGRIGLKTVEAFLGSNIKETDVPFDIDRKLTEEEIQITIKYCRSDVQQTVNAFIQTIDVFDAMLGIIKAFPQQTSLQDIGDTEARITAKVLGCHRREYTDEFDYFILPCIQLKKYKAVQDWFEDKKKEAQEKGIAQWDKWKKKAWYKEQSFEIMVAGVPHTFGFGGVHGAIDRPIHLDHKDGAGYHVDVNNYYPSLLLAWDLVTRSATNDNYHVVYDKRKGLKYKQKHAESKAKAKKYKKMQLPYKKLLNALSGGMKDETNPAYDPRNNNCMCINGQLMLLDLIEKLEVIPGFQLVQSNTDGLIVWIPDTDEAFDQMDDICYEWESRCSTDKCDIKLELDNIREIYQKDVNNYLWVDAEGGVERIGRYLKQLSPIDNDLPILNKAVVKYMAHKVPVEKTINEEKELGMFQKVVKLSNLYDHVEHEHCEPVERQTGVRVIKTYLEYLYTDSFTYKAFRVFASLDLKDGRLLKVRSNGKKEKFGSTPDHCFIWNDSTENVPVPAILDREYYIQEAKRTLKMFGIQT